MQTLFSYQSIGYNTSFDLTSINYHKMPASISESLAINQTPHFTSCVETRAATIKHRQAKEEQDFMLAIQEAFDKEQQTQIQHKLPLNDTYMNSWTHNSHLIWPILKRKQ